MYVGACVFELFKMCICWVYVGLFVYVYGYMYVSCACRCVCVLRLECVNIWVGMYLWAGFVRSLAVCVYVGCCVSV